MGPQNRIVIVPRPDENIPGAPVWEVVDLNNQLVYEFYFADANEEVSDPACPRDYQPQVDIHRLGDTWRLGYWQGQQAYEFIMDLRRATGTPTELFFAPLAVAGSVPGLVLPNGVKEWLRACDLEAMMRDKAW